MAKNKEINRIKKSCLACFIAFFILASLSGIFAATDIAYIVKNSASPDSLITNIFSSEGFSYKVVKDSEVPLMNFSEYRLLFIEGDIGNRDIIPYDNANTLFFNNKLAKEAWGSDLGLTSGRTVKASSLESGLLKNVNRDAEGIITVYSSSGIIYYLNTKPSYVENIALAIGSNHWKDPVIASELNSLTRTRTIFFGIPDVSLWTSDAITIFKNSVKFGISGQDKDGDGYFSGDDCNDDNANLWQNLKAYKDKDKDGFGSGNLIDVCSGNQLPEGYVSINGDCDDNDANVNPDEIEIPYDGKDNDCNGYDELDIDKDGYCISGYGITNKNLQCPKETGVMGTDCNDNDSQFNRGVDDIYKNCKNDAPIVDAIGKITAQEDDGIRVEIKAIDPENDTLSYSINNSVFARDNNIGNVFTWKTGYYDEGVHFFKASVSDGALTSNIYFEVEIIGKNQAPKCTGFPMISWNEDENHTINLNNYCSDGDSDSIIFSVQDSPENIGINIENGIASLSPEKDWNGETGVRFKLSDGKEDYVTNRIILKVNPVNDAPLLDNNLPNIQWNEDANFTNAIDLKDYISDIDSNLNFSVIGNNFIEIIINNGIVSFFTQKDWFGTERVIFSGSDREFTIESNEINLTVLNMREPPEFGELDCKTEVLEDTEDICLLNGSDFEGDNFIFSVASKNNLNCSIEGNTLRYISYKDFTGNASCVLRISDNDGYNDYLFSVKVINVNDAPVISDYSPKTNKILNNTDQGFSVVFSDIDSAASVFWYLDGEDAGTGDDYVFNKNAGDYNLTAFVRDGEFEASKEWNVNVRTIDEFTCYEANGHMCGKNEVCLGSVLGVKDTDKCCAVECSEKPPEFSDAEKCRNQSSSIIFNIKYPEENRLFRVGDSIRTETEITNNHNEDKKFYVEVHLYDTTKELSVSRIKESFELEKNERKIYTADMEIPEDLRYNDKYAIYVKVYERGDSDYCRDDYRKVNITRRNYHVMIDEIIIEPDSIVCKDTAYVSIRIENIGANDDFGYIKLDGSGSNANTGSFEIKSGEKVIKDLELKIPNSATGDYNIKAFWISERDSGNPEENITIVLGECREEIDQQQLIDTIKLSGENLPVIESNQANMNLFFVLEALTLLCIIIAIIIIFIVLRRKKLIRVTSGKAKADEKQKGKERGKENPRASGKRNVKKKKK